MFGCGTPFRRLGHRPVGRRESGFEPLQSPQAEWYNIAPKSGRRKSGWDRLFCRVERQQRLGKLEHKGALKGTATVSAATERTVFQQVKQVLNSKSGKMDRTLGRYAVRSVVRACEVLKAFRCPDETLQLREVVARTGLGKGASFRLLHTLSRCGLLSRVGTSRYRSRVAIRERNLWRIGFAAAGDKCFFDREVRDGLIEATKEAGIELIIVDNRYSPGIALREVETLIREHVNVIIEYQPNSDASARISSRCAAAGIPLIAVEIPHPGAVFFGADNYRAGLIGGRYLAKWAKLRWGGPPDEIILLEQRRAGALPQTRLYGTLEGIGEVLPVTRRCPVVRVDGDSDFERSFRLVRHHLRYRKAERVLVAGVDDICVLGALRALEEAGRSEGCAGMGQNGAPEARIEMRRPGTRLVGSVGYFPERYGDMLISLVSKMLKRERVPSAVFVKHQLITPKNVDHLYPGDTLMGYT